MVGIDHGFEIGWDMDCVSWTDRSPMQTDSEVYLQFIQLPNNGFQDRTLRVSRTLEGQAVMM